MTHEELVATVERLRVPHLVVEDCWYSCPKSGESCNENAPEDLCTCGADDHNGRVDEVLAAMHALIA